MSMYPRTNFEMTQADLDAILDACKPTPVMFLSGGTRIGGSKQENANEAWKRLGEKMGFDHMTVQPIYGKGNRFFSAVPSENEAQRKEREDWEAIEHNLREIQRLTGEIQARQEQLDALNEKICTQS